jgi:glycosyltransferase involved in cell wall biosynthesis/2-polyprenyl-3-methyl-5-hydroxy-6-metoxy-1,4-benzoquinol methylase
MIKPQHNLDIVMFVAGMDIDYDTLKTKSLGGSETAGVAMAHALCKQGHHVTLFCSTKNEGKHDGVRYINLDKFETYTQSTPHDVLIVQRVPEAFQHTFKSKINILWQHDFAQKSRRQQFTGALWNVDKVFCLSKWHIDNYKEVNKLTDCDDIFFQTSNGIKLLNPDNSVKRNPKQLVFTNRPERGMDILLGSICPKLWEKDKDIEVVIAGYDNTVPEMADFYNHLMQQIQNYQRQGYKIRHVGALNKQDLYKLYHESKLFVYPTKFFETSCITVMETQMCGLPIITSKLGALPETLGKGAGILINGDAQDTKYHDKFVNAVFDLLNDDMKYKHMQEAGYRHVKQYEWDNVAQQWSNQFLKIFKDKTANRQTLYKELLRREDIMTLKYLVEKVDMDEEWIKLLQKDYDYIDDKDKYAQKYKKLGQEYIVKEDSLNLRQYMRVDVALQHMGFYLKEKQLHEPDILDFASGIGNETAQMYKLFGANIDAINISKAENDFAAKLLTEHTKGDFDKINIIEADNVDNIPDKKYDIAFLGEILEHQPNPDTFLDEIERTIKDDGLITITVPHGLWEDERKAHLWNFERRDIEELLQNKNNVQIQVCTGSVNEKQKDILGWWVVSYRKNGKPCVPICLNRKVLLQNPRESVSLCMITKNAENMLHRTLKSVDGIVDEIIIADNGSTDSTLEIAKQYNTKIITCKSPLEIGFDTARNESIKHAKSDWILWLDSDEELLYANNMFKYLRPNIFNGYSIRQHHFSVDAGAMKVDLPVRLFRNKMGIKFLGHVHEHPELGINEGVGNSTILSDVEIAHDGYFTETGRRDRFNRNIALMKKDRELNPERLLGKFLWIRDLIHLARYEIEQNGKRLTPTAVTYLLEAQDMYRKEFLEDKNLYQEEATQFYSESLTMLNQGLEFRYNINASQGGTKAQPQDYVSKFKDYAEFIKYITVYYKDITEPYTGDFL